MSRLKENSRQLPLIPRTALEQLLYEEAVERRRLQVAYFRGRALRRQFSRN